MNDNGKKIPPVTANGNHDPRLWPVATVMATGVFATTFVQLQALGFSRSFSIASFRFRNMTDFIYTAAMLESWSDS